jgi:hypothetical protein
MKTVKLIFLLPGTDTNQTRKSCCLAVTQTKKENPSDPSLKDRQFNLNCY